MSSRAPSCSTDRALATGATTVSRPGRYLPVGFVESSQGLLRRSLVDTRLAAAGIARRDVVIELGHPEAIKRAAAAGLGVTVLFRSAVEHELEAGLLRELPVRDMRLSVPLYLVRRKAKVLSVVQRDIADAIRDHVAARGAVNRTAEWSPP